MKNCNIEMEKPYRINNLPKQGPSFFEAFRFGYTTVLLREKREKYELRILLKNCKNRNFFICISNDILYLKLGNNNRTVLKQDIVVQFLLPANVRQKKIQALYRPYGIKIIMPKIPADGIIVNVPIR